MSQHYSDPGTESGCGCPLAGRDAEGSMSAPPETVSPLKAVGIALLMGTVLYVILFGMMMVAL